MGNCWFFNYSPHSKGQIVSEPTTIKIGQNNSEEHSIINPQNLHIDLILENELPANLLSGSKKEGTEVSLDSPHKSPTIAVKLKKNY
jgi:hypothetical protein